MEALERQEVDPRLCQILKLEGGPQFSIPVDGQRNCGFELLLKTFCNFFSVSSYGRPPDVKI